MKDFSHCKDLETGKSIHFADDRGLFSTLDVTRFLDPTAINLSKNNSSVLRGLHYQTKPQAKLVLCVSGFGIDLALDLRRKSKTYGEIFSQSLNMGEYVFIPRGFAHGLISMDKLEVIYAVDTPYESSLDTGVNIDSIKELKMFTHFRRSKKDKNLPDFIPGHTYL
jgi:dTDP-4-dehydrorhamnose 3,5-epimerase